MKVTLIDHTKDADSLLIFSKKTRLNMSPDDYENIKALPQAEKEKELDYVFGTIGSSWEFVDYVFMIQGVTRAFTHQLVRHRVGVSFAQQAQRVVDMSEFEYLSTGTINASEPLYKLYEYGMKQISEIYSELVKKGAAPEDARGILPTNVLTNIMMKINLRALSGLLNIRLCEKAQGEFQSVARQMRNEVLIVHPWTERILRVHCEQDVNCIFPNYDRCSKKQREDDDEKS